MTFDGIDCPCGGRKAPQTMLCARCDADLAVAMPHDTRTFRDEQAGINCRRSSAIRLLAGARRRNGRVA